MVLPLSSWSDDVDWMDGMNCTLLPLPHHYYNGKQALRDDDVSAYWMECALD